MSLDVILRGTLGEICLQIFIIKLLNYIAILKDKTVNTVLRSTSWVQI